MNYNKKQLARNYTKKQFEKAVAEAKIQHKQQTTKKELVMRKLECSDIYDDARDAFFEAKGTPEPPKGLVSYAISDEKLLTAAKDEVKNVCNEITKKVGEEDEFTNYRFYINAAYFDRGRGDPFPLYKWKDPRVKSLCELIESALKQFGKEYTELLNVIIRVYRPGDILNFHTDRKEFGETVYGVILENLDPSRSLILTRKHSTPYMMEEKDGLVWALNDESRWDYEHGYCSSFNRNVAELIRTSITFRFFDNKELIPKKEFEPEPQ